MSDDAARCHCGREVKPRYPDPWEGRMDDFCLACAEARCDCYPDECPVKNPISDRRFRLPNRTAPDASRSELTVESHYSVEFEENAEGWWQPSCACGKALGMFPDAETACDALMEHAYAQGFIDATRTQ